MSGSVTTPSFQLSIEADVSLSMKGDQDAFSRIVDKTGNMVTAIVFSIVRDLQVCEDIAQDVFVSAWSNLNKLRNANSFLPWLRQTARNRANTWIRDRMRERAATVQADEMLAEAADPAMNPAEGLLAREEVQALYQVLDTLPSESREIVTLYYREGQSAKQVAALLDIREDAVRKRLSRSRNLLRGKLLELFENAAAKTAPGAAFTAAVMAGLSLSPPTAAAATLSGAKGAAGKGGASMSVSALPGLLAGFLGVFLAYRLAAARLTGRDERRTLKKWAVLQAVGVVAGVGGIVLTASTGLGIWAVTGYAFLSLILVLTLGVWLPRLAKEKMRNEPDPQVVKGLAQMSLIIRGALTFGLIAGWATLIWVLSQM